MNGFINVNKACGVSSAREVSVIKKLTGCPCGHMGTLDPMACGVLPVAVGNACRLFEYFLSKRKKYTTEFLFGVHTDTLDTTGKVLSEGGRVPEEEEISAVLPAFTGDIMQTPPLYSAKSVGGERGYSIARRGGTAELAPKKVNIGGIKLLGRSSANAFRFEIECGSGTYIRSLARDVGAALGTAAVMSALIRTQSGCFCIENAVETQSLTAENIASYLIPTDSVLPYPAEKLTPHGQKRYTNGMAADCGCAEGLYRVYLADGSFYGVGYSDGSKLVSRLKLC